MAKKKAKIYWTEEMIVKLVQLWKDRTVDEIAEEMGLDNRRVIYMAKMIRADFPNLMPRKHHKGIPREFIRNAVRKNFNVK